MTPCPTGQQLSAYYDGRLTGQPRELIEQHLQDCPPCRLELSRLVALSGFFSNAVRPHLSQIARRRLHDKADQAMERGLIRFGWSLSGIAASILLVGSALLMHVHAGTTIGATGQTTEAAPPWLGVAVSSDADSVVQNARTPAAALYLADASAGSSNVDVP